MRYNCGCINAVSWPIDRDGGHITAVVARGTLHTESG